MSELIKIGKLKTEVNIIDEPFEMKSILNNILASGYEEAFYLLDVEEIKLKYDNWRAVLPNIKPYYMVKCNNEEIVLRTLAAIGSGFNCISSSEIDQVLALGIPASNIIFTNPMKTPDELKHALEKKIQGLTFDNECELKKIKLYYPLAQLILRVRCNTVNSMMIGGIKFGCEPEHDVAYLLNLAKTLKFNVVGVSFYISTDYKDYSGYEKAIYYAWRIFTFAKSIGFHMKSLDLGGGFPGDGEGVINEIADKVNRAMMKYFPSNNIELIAQPGRYFVGTAFTLLCKIIAIKDIPADESKKTERLLCYFLNTGFHNTEVCSIIDQVPHAPQLCGNYPNEYYNSKIFGTPILPRDQIYRDIKLPLLNIDDWLLFPCIGSYTMSCGLPFNGSKVAPILSYINRDVWKDLSKSTEYLK